MNRYAATGVLVDMALRGRRVLAVMDSGRAVREALHSLEEQAHELGFDDLVEIRRANGQEQVRLKGGRGRVVLVTAGGTGGRGMHADVLFLDEPRHLDERRLAELMPCVVGGEVVYGR